MADDNTIPTPMHTPRVEKAVSDGMADSSHARRYGRLVVVASELETELTESAETIKSLRKRL